MGAKFGHEVSAETRAKISEKLRGRKIPPEVLAKRSATMMGHPVTAETRAKIARGKWKGDDIDSPAMHWRLRTVLPLECALADATCKGRLDISFRKHEVPKALWRISPTKGHPYTTDPDHYWRLCRSHHKRYDMRKPTP